MAYKKSPFGITQRMYLTYAKSVFGIQKKNVFDIQKERIWHNTKNVFGIHGECSKMGKGDMCACIKSLRR